MLLTLAGEERGDRRPLYQSNKELHEKFRKEPIYDHRISLGSGSLFSPLRDTSCDKELIVSFSGFTPKMN